MSFESLISQLPQAFADELATRFGALQAAHPSETFYGIATCHESDSCSCYLAAHSEEAIRRELEERSAASGTPVDQLSSDRYWVPEWEFEDSDSFVSTLHEQIWLAAEMEGLEYDVTKRRVFDAYVAGLKLFESRGGIDAFNREQFILIPWVHDPGDENTWVLHAVSELNPKSVSDAFAENYGYAD